MKPPRPHPIRLALTAGATACAFVAACTKPVPKVTEEKIVVRTESIPLADAPDGLHAVRNWAVQRIVDAEKDFKGTRREAMPSPEAWARHVVYDVAVDRFADGDPGNDDVKWPPADEKADATPPDDFRLYAQRHGGDLAGLARRIPYLKDLGVSVLVLSPVFTGQGAGPLFCVSDYANVDPRYGSIATLRSLVAAAHDAGMRVILKTRLDEFCAGGSVYDEQKTPYRASEHAQCLQSLQERDAVGSGDVKGQRALVFASTFAPALRHKSFFARCGVAPAGAGPAAGAYGADSGPDRLAFDTGQWDLQDLLADLHKYWVAMTDVDGFFLERAERVTPAMVAVFSWELRSYAARLGKRNFLVAGDAGPSPEAQAARGVPMQLAAKNPTASRGKVSESLIARVAALRERAGADADKAYPGLDAVVTYAHADKARGVAQGWDDPQKLKAVLQGQGPVPGKCHGAACPQARVAPLPWLALEREGWSRLPAKATNPFKLADGLGYLLTTWGMPSLYYGSEQGFNGACPADFRVKVKDKALRDLEDVCLGEIDPGGWRSLQDMYVSGPWRLGSTVSLVDQLGGVGYGSVKKYEAPEDDGYANRKQDLFKHARKLVAIRRSCRPLAEGALSFRFSQKNKGANAGYSFAFSRVLSGDEMIVLVNTGDHPVPLTDVTLAVHRPVRRGDSQKFVNLLTMKADATVDFGGRRLRFDRGYALPGSGLAVYVHESRAKAGEDGGVCLGE